MTIHRFAPLLPIAVVLAIWAPLSFGQDCTNVDLSKIDLSNTSPLQVADLASPDAKFTERAKAVTMLNACQPLLTPDSCGGNDYGEGYQTKLFARLAWKDLFGNDPTGPSGTMTMSQEAISSLAALQRSDFGSMGTDTSHCFSTDKTGDQILDIFENVFSNAQRKGDFDVFMNAMTLVLYKYGNRLPPNVYNNVLSLIDLSPGPGSVETLSYGGNPVTVCPLVCAADGENPICLAGCAIALKAESVTIPETENHRNNIYVAQFLANQLLLARTGDPKYDNSRNGYRPLMLNRLHDFVRNDFIEYNSHNYQDYTMTALLNLYSFSNDPAITTAAKQILDYISAKVVVSSDDARRSVPFRRHNDPNGGSPIHLCDELILQECSDPQTPFYMMLAGVTDILGINTSQNWTIPGALADNLPPKVGIDQKNNTAPGNYAYEFQWASVTNYRVDPIILDLFVNRSHRNFYQFFHYSRTLDEDGFNDSNDEIYFSSPSYLISGGGHPTHSAYSADVPFPISVITGSHPFKQDDVGVDVATVLMPTGALHSREEMIRFSNPGSENLCVGPNFACGANPMLGNYAVIPDPTPDSKALGTWSFIDQSAPPPQYGFYAAVYQQAGFGFMEVYDTLVNSQSYANIGAFEAAVHANNDVQTESFTTSGNNTYKTVDGNLLQFTVDAHIVTLNGNPPYDPNRTNGTIINNDGTGVVTISNPALGKSITLDGTVPPNHPGITIPAPLTFPDTCVGATSSTTLNICNDGNGTDNLFVYNILSQNNQFQVTEPTSGFPTTIGSNFCFPFQAQFSPLATGAQTGKLTISNSDPTVPFLKLPVSGNGIQQAIATLISSGGNFGNVCIGSYTDLNLTINNNGGCDLVVNNIALGGPGAGDFSVAATLSFPLTIHAGGSLAVPIRFHPSSLGQKNATITVSSNDPNNASASVNVSGNAPPPVINATIANSGAFGNVCAGTQSDLTLQVVNQGQCNLTISNISAISNVPSFVLPSVTNFPLVLSANATVNLPVRFQPPAFGSPNYLTCSNTRPQMANVLIHSDDPRYPDPVGFVTSVNGIEGCPKLVLSPQNLTGAFAFPATVSDPNGTLGCYTDRQITVSNAGICPLNIVSITTANGLDGKGSPLAASPLEFKVTNPTVPLTIAPGAAPVPVMIRFKPVILADQSSSAPDQQTGTLSIVSNDPILADNGAGLCGEPAYHSGVRVLVDNATGAPINPLKSLSLSSKGLKPNVSQTLSPAIPVTAPNVCGNSITYTLDNETLPPAGTTGNNPNASYQLSAKQGSTQANVSFTLGPCDLKSIVLQIR